jgi:hypothetical protein
MQNLKLNAGSKQFITYNCQGMKGVPFFLRTSVYCYYFHQVRLLWFLFIVKHPHKYREFERIPSAVITRDFNILINTANPEFH